MKKRLLQIEATEQSLNDKGVYYLAKMLDENTLYLEFWKKFEGQDILVARHLNNKEDMATEDCINGKVTQNGFSKLVHYYWEQTHPIGGSREVVAAFVGSSASLPDDYLLDDVIKTVSSKRNEKKKARKQDRIDKMFSELKPLPKDWQKFLDNQVVPERFAFFDAFNKTVYFDCCKSTISRKGIKAKEKDYIKCPNCGKEVQYLSASPQRKKPVIEKTAILYNNIGEDVCCRYFTVRYRYKDAKTIEKSVFENVRTVYSLKNGIKNYEVKVNKGGKWGECIAYPSYGYYSRYPDGIHYPFYYGVLYKRNRKAVINKSAFGFISIKNKVQNSMGDYRYEALLNKYSNHPYLEQLEKAKLYKLVSALIYGRSHINLKEEKRPYKILGISKCYVDYLRRVDDYSDECVLHLLEFLRAATEKGIFVSFDDALSISSYMNDYYYHRILSKLRIAEIKKVFRLYYEEFEADTFVTYLDYIEMLEKLGLNSKSYRFPKDLTKAHDNVAKQIQLKKTEALTEDFGKRYEELKDLSCEIGDYTFVIPKKPEDFINESNALHHCLASNYCDKYANGQTNIVFVRNKNDVKTPFVTVEFNNMGTIIQARAVRNTTPCKECLEAIDEFKLKVAS